MTKHRFEVVAEITMTIEVDDTIVSEFYSGETVLTAHENRERFVEGTTRDDALMAAAVAVAAEGRSLSKVDGWADFPDGAVQAIGAWPTYTLSEVYEVPIPEPVRDVDED